MRTRLSSVIAVIGAVTVLVLAASTLAVAAGGKPFLLGRQNAVGNLTTLVRSTPGPVLRLQAKKPASAPFTTNATGKVKNLNADRVDGLDSTDLANRVLAYQVNATTATQLRSFGFPGLKAGTYVASYALTLSGGSGFSYCRFTLINPGKSAVFLGFDESDQSSPGLATTSLVRLATGGSLALDCESGTAWQVKPVLPMQAILTPVTATARTAQTS